MDHQLIAGRQNRPIEPAQFMKKTQLFTRPHSHLTVHFNSRSRMGFLQIFNRCLDGKITLPCLDIGRVRPNMYHHRISRI